MIGRLALAAAGRRSKWVVLAVWLLLVVLGSLLAQRLEQVQTNDASSFLPAEAESTRVLDLQLEAAGSNAVPAVQLVVPLGEDDGFELGQDMKQVQRLVQSSPEGGDRADGLRVWVTGPGGLPGDFLDVFETIRGQLSRPLSSSGTTGRLGSAVTVMPCAASTRWTEGSSTSSASVQPQPCSSS